MGIIDFQLVKNVELWSVTLFLFWDRVAFSIMTVDKDERASLSLVVRFFHLTLQLQFAVWKKTH